MLFRFHGLLAFCVGSMLVSTAAAASRIVPGGQTLSLQEDLVLSGNDVLDIQGTPGKRCRIAGNGHQIKTTPKWTGRLKMSCCEGKEAK